MRLREKVAVVTGAGAGIGRSMASLFAAEGARVVVAVVPGYRESVGSWSQALRDLRDRG